MLYPSRPAVNVSWYEAAAYASWCGCRLPTEAEWERAVRGPSNEYRKYSWGNDEPTKDSVNWYKAGAGYATPVGIFPEDCSPEDVIDMAGNVVEWCQDCFSEKYYEECARKGIVKNPKGPGKGESHEGEDCILRGGTFGYHLQNYLRCAYRNRCRPGNRGNVVGFRVVRL